MNFIVSVDVEADGQWQRPSALTVDNTKFLPRFQDLCQRYGFPPTYFITYEVASDPASVAILKDFKNRQAEIASHLHPWSTPPFLKEQQWELEHHRFPSELDDKEMTDKLAALTKIITDNFSAPKSFRAGRWGLDNRLLHALENFGYLVDASVTPKVSWVTTKGDPSGKGGPDWRQAPVRPYYPKGNKILEVPMSIVFTGPIMKEDSGLVPFFLRLPEGKIKQIANRSLFRQKWLRIFQSSKAEDWERIYQAAEANDLPVLQFMIHSSELMPGGSPYAKDEAAVEFIYQQLESMFDIFKRYQLKGTTLKDFAIKYKNHAAEN